MGQFLAIGLRIKATIYKDEMEKHLNGKTIDDVLGQIEAKFGLSDIYDRNEKDDCYVYSLKKDILDKEYVPFIERFYALRYSEGNKHDSGVAIEELKKLADTSARLAVLEDRSFQTYQEGDGVDYFDTNEYGTSYIRIYNYNAILSIDGKIIMECYGELFDFFRRCIVAQMPEFELSKALTVWIDG